MIIFNMEAALDHLRDQDIKIRPADIARDSRP